MSQLFLSILALALVTWAAKSFFILYYNRRKKEEINKLEARTAVLRMLLKAKLKRKGSQMQDQYKEDKDFLLSMAAKLDLLTTFNFVRSSDFEDVLEILTSISEAIDLLTVQKNPNFYMAQQAQIQEDREKILQDSGFAVEKIDAAGEVKSLSEIQEKQKSELAEQMPEFNRWSQLLKYDKGNLYIIKEIVETSVDLKKRVEAYNLDQEKKENHLSVPDVVTIKGFDGLRGIVLRDQEKSKAAKEAKKQKKLQNQDVDADSAESTASGADESAVA